MTGHKSALIAALLLGLLVVPTSLAQDAAVVGATVTLEFPLDTDVMEEVYPVRVDPVDQALDPCGTNHFIVSPSFDGFRFTETNQEHGCGEARFTVNIPEGATGMDLVYRAERTLQQPATNNAVAVQVHVVQEVRIYDAGDLSVPLQVRQEFPEGQGDASTGSAPRAVPFILPDVSAITIGWYFEDRGPAVRDEIPNILFGQSVAATVASPSVRFHGVPAMDVTIERVRGTAGREAVDIERHVSAAVPEGLPPDATVTMHFQVLNTLSVGHVLTPDGARLPDAALEVSETSGVLDLTLSPEVIQTHGGGTYTAVFVGSEPLQSSTSLAFAVIALLIFPIPTGAYATQGARDFSKHAFGGYRTQAGVLRGSIFVWWGVYLILLGVVFIGGLWKLVTSWPLELQAALIHIGFGGVSAAFLFTGLFWRRRLVAVMEEDLEEKRRTNDELARSNSELEQFAYVASHDLQEPLRTISRFTQLVQHRYGKDLPKDANEFMDYTVDGAQRMQALVDDLLTYSRVGTKGREFEDISLEDVADQVVAGLTVAIEEKKATVTKDSLPVILGDRPQIAQVYQNLISNAIKFRRKNRRPKVHLGAEEKDGMWVLSVSDNGIGIPPEQHERIFVIFQRLHARDEYEGTGIGLAVVKKIVERHGGRIWVESDSKNGTTFFFSLPPGSR